MCSPVFVVGLSKLVEVLAGCRNCLYFLNKMIVYFHSTRIGRKEFPNKTIGNE